MRVYTLGPPQILVGEIAQGGRVSARAVAGSKFKVVEEPSGRPLLQMTVRRAE